MYFLPCLQLDCSWGRFGCRHGKVFPEKGRFCCRVGSEIGLIRFLSANTAVVRSDKVIRKVTVTYLVITVIICIFAQRMKSMKVWMTPELEELYLTGNSKMYKDVARIPELFRGFTRAIDALAKAENTEQLKSFSYLHYEKLKYEFSGISSIRLSNRHVHRLLFTEFEDGIEVQLITIDDTHYGNKT